MESEGQPRDKSRSIVHLETAHWYLLARRFPHIFFSSSSRGIYVSQDKLTNHLQIECYGDFRLTRAIRPGIQIPIVPRAGYRQSVYRDKKNRITVPIIAAAVSSEQLFDVFMSLLAPLGDVVDVVLETSHKATRPGHRDLQREDIDRPVLESHLYDFEELLLNDGCTGIAVASSSRPMEVQFDEHKVLIVYARNPKPFCRILKTFGLAEDDDLRLINEAEHLHRSEPEYCEHFEQLCYRLGVGGAVERVSW